MDAVLNFNSQPWPWYVAGPLIGLVILVLQWLDNKPLAASASYRHVCAATFPSGIKFLNYNWKAEIWNLFFIGGILVGGFIVGYFFQHPENIAISYETKQQLQSAGLTDTNGYFPAQLFSLSAIKSAAGLIAILAGGFLIGFGSRYAGGCVSGHSMTGISDLQWTSLLATACIFAGGIFTAYVLIPLILNIWQ